MELERWFTKFSASAFFTAQSRRSRRIQAAATEQYANCVDVLEARCLLTSDFGDAPDVTAGAGVNDYQTLVASGGPSHVIDATRNTLFLGGGVDGETGNQQSPAANMDDRFTAGGRDDEDGVLNPQDLMATVGTMPRITLSATNTTGVPATLYGWIDYNQNGVFENATERAHLVVPAGTTNGRFTLTFPVLPMGGGGVTYARFRLSSDVAAASSTGAANGGEIEDYQFEIQSRLNDPFLVDYIAEFAGSSNGLPDVSIRDAFGISVASLGDLDGNGMEDLAVGAPGDSSWRGAVYILFRKTDGSVDHSMKIASSLHGGPALIVDEGFGANLASLGDIDGDGITDLAVGAYSNINDELYNASAVSSVYILRMNADGTVKSFTQLASQQNGIPQLPERADFCIVKAIGDMDGDGIGDIVVGAPGTAAGGTNRGAIHIVRLNADGTAKKVTTIANTSAWNRSVKDENNFGETIASLGDIDHDGVVDLAVVSETGDFSGIINILKLKPDGSMKSVTQLAMGDGAGLYSNLADIIVFGLENAGDIDGNGVSDLVYSGSKYSRATGKYIGVVNTLLLDDYGLIEGSTAVVSLGGYASNYVGTYSSITFLSPTADGDRQIAVTQPFVGASGVVQANLTMLTLKNFPPVIPDVPIVSAPLETTTWTRPTIRWSNSKNATSSILWVRNLSTGEILVDSLELSGTDYTPDVEWGIGKYSVYVRAKNDVGLSAWSTRYVFVIKRSTFIVPMPDGLNPRPTFSWGAVPGAVKYDFWLAGIRSPQVPVIATQIDASATTYTPPKDLADGTYRWWVRGMAKDGSFDLWSMFDEFSIESRTEITGVADEFTNRPDFTCMAVRRAVRYDLWISNLSNPSRPPIQTMTDDASTTFHPNVDLATGRYRIWIRGVAADGSFGTWSRSKDFSTGVIPQLTVPATVFAPGDGIPLSWDAVEGAAQIEIWHQWAETGSLNHRTYMVSARTLYWFNGSRIIGKHQVWVRAVSADGRTGRWSNRIEVTVNGPVEYMRVASTDGAYDRPAFSWDALYGAARYEVRIDDVANNVTGWMTASNLVVPAYSPGVSLPLGTYSFQVRAIANDGTVCEWSEPLMPQASLIPHLLPTDGNLTFLPTLRWTPVIDAESYTIDVRNSDTGKSLGPFYAADITSLTVPVEYDGRYSWSVRANGPGLPATMSEPQSFVVTTKPVLTVPATFDFNQETKTIYWTEITGGSPYEIWLSTDQNTKVLHDREYFETSYNLPTALPKGRYRVWVRCVASYYDASTWSLPAVFEIK